MPTALRLVPFVPSGPDFKRAIQFFYEIGFATLWRHEGLAGLKFGGATFMLQDITIQLWQDNQMLTLEVDDLDAYWAVLDAKHLPWHFPGVRIKPPADYPWGREVHLIDPAGVCWHIRQGR